MLRRDAFWSAVEAIWRSNPSGALLERPGARARAAEIRRREERAIREATIGSISR